MARTIQQAFLEMKGRLEITGLQTSTVSTRQKGVRDTVSAGMAVVDDFLTGSYARSTMIAPLKDADVDVFVVLDPSLYHHYNGINGGPKGLLDLGKRTLLKTYTRTPDISRNGQAVTIRFDDFVVDVVFGFNRSGGGYIMANALNNTWLETDPKRHVDLIAQSNKAHNGDFVPLVKMLKGWNKSNGSFFRSFHLEVLALEILNNVQISDYSSGCRFFFDKARTLVRGKNPDPAGFGDDIGRYIVGQTMINDAGTRFERAFATAVNAEMAANRGDLRGAIETWGRLFSPYFPAYG